MKILMLSMTFPYPPTRGGTQVRTFNLLKYLGKKHEITLITYAVPDISGQEIEELAAYIHNLKIFSLPLPPNPTIFAKTQRFAEFIWQGTPPNVKYLYSSEIQNWIDGELANQGFDVITCEHISNEIFIRPHWQEKIKIVANIHSSVYRTCKNQLETGVTKNPIKDRLYLPLLRRYEYQFCQKFTDLVVTTPEDKVQIEALELNRPITVIANGVDLEMFPYRRSDPQGYRLIITGGMDYSANVDSACFFGLEIFPILQKKYPLATLTIVGSNPDLSVINLAKNPGITVTGRVPTMVEYLHQATICVVPLRAGFGIKNKTLEAMAAGVPVVASDRGLEGMKVDEPLSAWRANEIEEYIEAISRLFEDVDLRATLSHNARQLIEQEYTWEKSSSEYERLLSGNLV